MTKEEAISKLDGKKELLDRNGFINLDEFDIAINSIQENTKLKAEIDELNLENVCANHVIDKLKAEIERLNGKSEMYRDMADSFCNSNIKLKAEIEQLKQQRETRTKVSEANFNIYSKLEIERDNLVSEIEQWQSTNLQLCTDLTRVECENHQLKSELEQSVRLPYLAGTPLYFAFSKQGIVKDKIRRWQINEHGIVFYSKGSAYPVEFIGKYAFLTREEAEQSLKRQV